MSHETLLEYSKEKECAYLKQTNKQSNTKATGNWNSQIITCIKYANLIAEPFSILIKRSFLVLELFYIFSSRYLYGLSFVTS
jgi:hypothetical protein